MPYEEPYSREFFVLIKNSKYKEVENELRNNRNYLLSFDFLGRTPYHWAIKLDDFDMLQILVNFGNYVNQKDYMGNTPLHIVAQKNDLNYCQFLINNGANYRIHNNNGKRPYELTTNEVIRIYFESLDPEIVDTYRKESITKNEH